jgi:hypothetical protein
VCYSISFALLHHTAPTPQGQKKRQPRDDDDDRAAGVSAERSDEVRRLAGEDAEDFANQALILALFLQVLNLNIIQ